MFKKPRGRMPLISEQVAIQNFRSAAVPQGDIFSTIFTLGRKAKEEKLRKKEEKLNRSTISRFAHSLQNVESERVKHRDFIKRKLVMLPPRFDDPEYMPAMNPVIQKASTNFPKVARSILERHELSVEQFNNLQRKMERNPIFRYQLNQEIDRQEKMFERHRAAGGA
jgi:hypothetical protein